MSGANVASGGKCWACDESPCICPVDCPFCKDDDFDLPGLKAHFENGDCEVYNETEDLERI